MRKGAGRARGERKCRTKVQEQVERVSRAQGAGRGQGLGAKREGAGRDGASLSF